MGIQFTPEQQKVIDVRGHNVLVSAAAGSGKTAVLTERIVKLVSEGEDPADIDRLLVVTFTNAAAAEMRERIGAAIAKRLDGDPGNEHLQKQAALIHNAQITTIDSFCMFIIRNNFNDIGLDPGFRVADEGELKLLRQDVMETLLEERYAQKEEEFLHCVEYFSTGSSDHAIEDCIMKLYQFAESHPWPEEWLEERKRDYTVSSVEELESSDWLRFGMEQVRYTIEDCVRKAAECIAICEQSDGPYMYAAVLEKDKERLERLLTVNQYRDGFEAFRLFSADRLPAKKDESVSVLKKETVKAIRNGIKDAVKKLTALFFPVPVEKIMENMEGSRKAAEMLAALTLSYKEMFDARKREENIIDFSDMEHLALSILLKKTENGYVPGRTAMDYRAYFKEILIDEYQDSNLVQEYLLKSISGEDDGIFNRFMVGDVKQSIYKFRLARPEIFMEKYNDYKDYADAAKEDEYPYKERIDLHKNFRSRTEIIGSVNYIFSQIMGHQLGGVEYDGTAALHAGAAYPDRAQAGNQDMYTDGSTELLLVRDEEARAVAKRIKELVLHFPVTDKEDGSLRPARYGDIVILLRTTAKWDEEFKRVMKDEGIPCHTTSRTGYFAAKEIKTLLQLLRILDNPLQDIPLFGVMTSYFGGFSEEEIAIIKTRAENKEDRLYFALKDEAVREEGRKAADFLTMLDTLRDKTVYMPIHELIQEIVFQTGYMHYIKALPGGDQRKANVEVLLQKAAAFEQTSYYGLFHFIRYIEQLEKYDVDYGEANILDENADVVRIMSIHKSKGLEFPICFVCGLSKRFNMQDANGKMLADVDMGMGIDYVDTNRRLQSRTLRKNMIAQKMRLDSLGEELRVLYVALTRAKEKLILTGVVADPAEWLGSYLPLRMLKERKVPYSDLAGARSLLDFVLAALVRHQSFDSLFEENEYESTVGRHSRAAEDMETAVTVRLITEEDTSAVELKEAISLVGMRQNLEQSDREAETDQELLKYMETIFSYIYEHENLSKLFTKTTVSELKKAGQEEEAFARPMYEEETIIPYIPKFMRAETVLKGAGRGSAFHKVMELFDFAKFSAVEITEEMVEAEIDRMLQEGLLVSEYAEAVSVPLIWSFMGSELATRMCRAAVQGKLYREQPFVTGIPAKELSLEFPEEEIVLMQGIIDVWFEEENGLVVADYKTDKADYPEELKVKYEKQLEYYARSLRQLTGKEVRQKIIYSFGLQKEIVI